MPYTEKSLEEGKSGEWCEMKRTERDRKKEIGGNCGSDGKFCSWGSEMEKQGQKHNNGGKLRKKERLKEKKWQRERQWNRETPGGRNNDIKREVGKRKGDLWDLWKDGDREQLFLF